MLERLCDGVAQQRLVLQLLLQRCDDVAAARLPTCLSKLELQQLTLPLLVLLQRTVAWYQCGYEHHTNDRSSLRQREMTTSAQKRFGFGFCWIQALAERKRARPTTPGPQPIGAP